MRVNVGTVSQLITALGNSSVTEIVLLANKVFTVSEAYSGLNAFPSITNGRSVTIYGNNATIERDENSGSAFRFFHVENAKLTLNGITFRHGFINIGGEIGGAIFAEQTGASPEIELNIVACTFDANVARAATGACHGGAVGTEGFWASSGSKGHVFICNSIFKENSGDFAGALHIVDVEKASIQGTTFENNEADNSAAIDVLGGYTENIEITECGFYGNIAQGKGGAIGNGGCNMAITDSIFAANSADAGTVVYKEKSTTQTLSLYNCSIEGNITTGSGNKDVQAYSPVAIGISAVRCWWGAANGPSGEGTGSGDSVSTHVAYQPFLTQIVPEHKGINYCPIVYTTNDNATSANPISLRLGEKRLMETDLRIATVDGSLEFSRTYRQEMLGRLTSLGLGWSHNHHFFANPPTGSGDERQFFVELPDAGIAYFEFFRVNPNNPNVEQYRGMNGSTSKANINTVTGRCKIKTSDRTTYVFQYSSALSLYFLTQRITASGETWTYLYSSSPEKLLSVVDDFGCRLDFSYYDTSDFKDGLLNRVEAARNGMLASAVDFDYVETMEDGTPTIPAQPLLAEITDVRGHIWSYVYYGSSSGEDGDPNPLNFFKKRLSPEISSLGDDPIELEEIAYTTPDNGATIDTITQARGDGLLETTFEYHTGDEADQTLETTASSSRRHTFVRDILAETVYPDSSVDPERLAGTGTRQTNVVFRPSQQEDANGNATRMVWRERGMFLDFVSDASGATTEFTYEALQEDDEADLAEGGRLEVLTNAAGFKTNYIYDDQLRQPTLILNGSGLTETAIKLNDSDISTSWKKINNSGNVTVNEIWNQVGHGYLRRIETTDDASGIQSQGFDLVNGKTYVVSVMVRTLQGSCDLRVSLNGIAGAFEDETITASDWTKISFSHLATGNASTSLMIETTDVSGGSFEIYSASVVEDERAEKIDDAFFELPKSSSPWSEFGTTASVNQRVAGTDTGKKARRVVTNAADVGIESDAAISLTEGKQYLWIARVFPITGVVKMKLSAAVGAVVETNSAGSQMMRWQTLRALVNTVSSTQSSVRLQFLSHGAGAEFIVDSVHVIEFDTLQSWRDFQYDFIWRTLTENSVQITDASSFQQSQKIYDVSASKRGLLLSTIQVDTTNSSENQSTTYSYDTAGRQTEIQHSSMLGSCQVSYTVYDEAGNVVANICNYDLSTAPTPTTEPPTDAASAAALYNPSYPDKNLVTTHDYDEMNRRFSTTSNAGRDYAKTSYSVFDSLNRVRLTIDNYANPEVMSVPTYTPPYTWSWNGTAWVDGSSQVISHGDDNDENVISETAYNERGLVRLQRDVVGNTTLLGYDTANRLIKTVRSASHPDYDNTVAGDVELALYPGMSQPLSTASDEDIISEQIYDPAGNTVITIQNPDFEDVRMATMNGYDGLNRVVKTITAASDLEYDFYADHALMNYVPIDDVDQDIINMTVFDVLGRVESTADPLGHITRTVYDELGRPRLTIQNYVPQLDNNGMAVNPSQWRWREVNGDYAWRYSSADPTPISHGINQSENIIAETIYGTQDTNGILIPDARRTQTRDVLGRLSYRLMDGLGRQVKSIANYVPVGSSDPVNWIWRDDAWHTGPTGGELVDFGADNDQNVLTETVYDTDGRVESTRSADGLVTRNVYDANSRQVKTIRSYVEQLDGGLPTDPLDWIWREVSGEYAWRLSDTDDTVVDHGDGNDLNIISETQYDTQNRAYMTRDSRGLLTRQVYDESNRVVMTVTNFNAALADNAPEAWAWREVASVFDWYTDSDDPVGYGTENDQNIIAATEEFDLLGRVVLTRDVAGLATLQLYDELGRQVRTVTNYVVQGATDPKDWVWRADGGVWGWYVADSGSTLVNHGTHNDVNLISDTQYDKAGRVVLARDASGTATAYAYDRAGRQRNVTTAYGTGMATTSYTCFDKGGRTLRQIGNWIDDGISPDLKMGDQFVFNPETHGVSNDQNLIISNSFDGLGRVLRQTNPVGDSSVTIYTLDSQPAEIVDPLGVITRHVYDQQRRTTRVIQNFYDQRTRIAFTSNRDRIDKAESDIFIMESNGSNVVRLTTDGVGNDAAAWSPDGTKIAFFRRISGGYNAIYTMNSDGSAQTAITDIASYNLYPTWSADAAKIICKGWGVSGFVLRIMDSDGDNSEILWEPPVNRDIYQPNWSWARDQITFELNHTDAVFESDIAVLNADGSGFRLLVADGNKNRNPAWSPDGSRIAFDSSTAEGVYQIYVMQSDGSHLRQLTFTDQANVNPTWSPDGTQLMFYSWRDSMPDRQLYVMNADGSEQRRITVNNSTDNDVAWSPIQTHPAAWEWVADHWENEDGETIVHGEHNDTNIVVTVHYNLAGQSIELRNPGGTLADESDMGGAITAYRYDAVGRRITRVLNYVPQGTTDPADWVWSSANDRWERGVGDSTAVSHGTNGDENMIMQTRYVDLDADDNITGQTRTVTTQPDGTEVIRDFDRLGRALTIGYDDLATTPDVEFAHDVRSNRVRMTETGSGGTVRETLYEHDFARRLIEASFDTDGDNDIDETVGYAYDLGGRRTLLAMPGNRDVTYSYDARGQMRMLTDWDDQISQFRYDAVGRHTLTQRANGLRSLYRYDAGGRLRLLRHASGARLFAQFGYEVDARGNRTQAFEAQRHPGSGTTIIDQSDASVWYDGAWSTDSGFRVTTDTTAVLRVAFAGNEEVELTVGEGPDHGRFDIYIGGSLWQTIDGYAASAGERVIPIPLSNDGPFTLEINNRADHGPASSGNTLRFKQISIDAEYTLQTIRYTYDAASRVLGADYYPGENTASAPIDTFAYAYDVAGNLTDNNGTARTFNKLNQISDRVTYDANGNMTDDGTNAYTWDRANRLLTMGDHAYAYDGMGNRISQTVSHTVTKYLLDVQPGLVQVLRATRSGGIILDPIQDYVYSPRGLHAARKGMDADWTYTLQDGLGSIRGEVRESSVYASGAYEPYGVPMDVEGTYSQPFRFTGEMRDENSSLYLRTRYLLDTLGVFVSMDTFEGNFTRATSMNMYAWVENNVINSVDPSGRCMASVATLIGLNSCIPPIDSVVKYDVAGCSLPLPTGMQIEKIYPGSLSWAGQKKFATRIVTSTIGSATSAYIRTPISVFGECNRTNRRNCSEYAYVALYSWFQLKRNRPPTLGEYLAILYTGELGTFQGAPASIEAFGRNFFEFTANCNSESCTTNYSYASLVDFGESLQFWIDAPRPFNDIILTRITGSGQGYANTPLWNGLIGSTPFDIDPNITAGGYYNFDAAVQDIFAPNNTSWMTGQGRGVASRWANKVFRKRADGTEMTLREMERWVVDNTAATAVFGSREETCSSGVNAGRKLGGFIVDAFDIAPEECRTVIS